MGKIQIRITSTVNGGVCICWPDNKKVWVDLYPEEKTRSFSVLTESQWDLVKCDPRFSSPNMILATHTHPDHFSTARTMEASGLWPDSLIAFPEGEIYAKNKGDVNAFPCERISGEKKIIEKDGIRAVFFRTVHSGRMYAGIPHYSIIISYMGINILLSGDAAASGENLIGMPSDISCDIAILNFPWASLRSAREAVINGIRSSHVLLVHIPNVEDNIDGFREMARTGAALLDIPDVRLMLYPFREEAFLI